MSQLKRRLDDSLIIVTSDFNQWDIDTTLADSIDLGLVNIGPTRGSRAIDKFFVNFISSLSDNRSYNLS